VYFSVRVCVLCLCVCVWVWVGGWVGGWGGGVLWYALAKALVSVNFSLCRHVPCAGMSLCTNPGCCSYLHLLALAAAWVDIWGTLAEVLCFQLFPFIIIFENYFY